MVHRRELIESLRGLDVTEWFDDAGTHYPEHAHASDEVIVVLEGSMTMVLGDQQRVLGPGDRLELPAGAAHVATVGHDGVRYLIGR